VFIGNPVLQKVMRHTCHCYIDNVLLMKKSGVKGSSTLGEISYV